MFKNKFYLRNVVSIAICLAAFTVFTGCNKDDGPNNSNNSPAKTTGNFKYGDKAYNIEKTKILWAGRGNADVRETPTDWCKGTAATICFHLSSMKGYVTVNVVTNTNDITGTFQHDTGHFDIIFTYYAAISTTDMISSGSLGDSSNGGQLQIKRVGNEYEIDWQCTSTNGKQVSLHYKGNLQEVNDYLDLTKI